MKRTKRTKRRGSAGSCVRTSFLLVCLLFLLPLFTVRMIRGGHAGEQEEPITILPPGERDSARTVRVLLDGTVQEMSMAEYLQGVLRAEMPASFEQEALCAQAVAARTYAWYKMASGGNHGDIADVCGDHTCCQAYLDRETAEAGWGSGAARNEAKIENAVAATDGETMLYGGEPILAVFHSSSAGATKSSGKVWTSDLPYLQSVSSPEDGESIPNYYSRVEVPAEEFRETFRSAHPEAELSGDAKDWFGDAVVTEGGNVDSVAVGGVSVRGTELRSLFSLRSASFEIEVQDGNVVFFVTGYGHGVGMSQYGANAMAAAGSTWREILTHYYTGVAIEPYDAN